VWCGIAGRAGQIGEGTYISEAKLALGRGSMEGSSLQKPLWEPYLPTRFSQKTFSSKEICALVQVVSVNCWVYTVPANAKE
jgi:hypothetical protein